MQNVYLRIITYMLSTIIGSTPAYYMGWLSVAFVGGWLQIHIQVEGMITALISGAALSLGIFKRWGTK